MSPAAPWRIQRQLLPSVQAYQFHHGGLMAFARIEMSPNSQDTAYGDKIVSHIAKDYGSAAICFRTLQREALVLARHFRGDDVVGLDPAGRADREACLGARGKVARGFLSPRRNAA